MLTLFQYHNIKKRQNEVDFLVPLLDLDRRFGLDPSLLRLSGSEKRFASWNQEIIDFLDLVHHVMKGGDSNKLRNLLSIGEAPDAGLGYCVEGVAGNGMGKEISSQVIAILAKNSTFKRRGFIRLEELQWLDKNIGPDRISDLAINILKRHIITYTRRQAKLHNIPMERVRVNKVFNPDKLEWTDIVTELPINPLRHVKDALNPHPPLLLLPKEIVKALPLFLSYDEFYGYIDPKYKPGVSPRLSKGAIVEKVIKNPELSTKFVKSREKDVQSLYRPDFNSDIQKYISELEQIPTGSRKHADIYRDVVKNILDIVFDEALTFYKHEKQTILRENRRDLIYRNEAASGIFSDFKSKHKATHIVFDTKNTDNVTSKDVAQLSNYLNNDIGRVGFIVSRKKDTRLRTHSYAQLSKQDKIILFISDEDLKRWATDKTRIQHVSGKKISRVDAISSVSNMYSDLVSD